VKPYPWFRLRRPHHYDEIYVSPHMDDAVYSCGGQIAQRRAAGARVLVLTVFGNGRDDDQGSGLFGDLALRKREERAAMDLLDLDHLLLNLPDLLVRKRGPGDLLRYALPFAELGPSELQRDLQAAVLALGSWLSPGGKLFFPLGVGAHPDHRLVFEVGQSMADRSDVWFYEDVPYAQVPALREERLHQLGLAPAHARWAAPVETHDFVFAHSPAWQRPFTRALVFGYWAATQLLARMRSGRLQARAQLERDISDVVERKVAAMRAYASQTAFFYPEGDALYGRLARAGERYVERYWQLAGASGAPAVEPGRLQRERARLEATAQLA
jgi:LmbE family N-acetylglucosaminyl deacetylase